MIALSSPNATLLLTTLISNGFFSGTTLVPEEIVNNLLLITENHEQLQALALKANLATDIVGGFLNNSAKCFADIAVKIPKTSLLRSIFVVDGIRSRW